MFWDRNPGLSEHWLLMDVATEAIQPLLYVGRMVHFEPGEVLFWEGDLPNGIYLITSGAVQVTAIAPPADVKLAVAGRNEVLGEIGVLDGLPRSGTAMAVEPTTAYFIPVEPFLRMVERTPMVAMRLLALLATRLRLNNRRICELPAAWETQELESLDAALVAIAPVPDVPAELRELT